MQVQTLANATPANKRGTTAVVGLQHIVMHCIEWLQHIIIGFDPDIDGTYYCAPDLMQIWIIFEWMEHITGFHADVD